MVYMVTFTINIPPMLVYIPYMDPMGDDWITYPRYKLTDLAKILRKACGLPAEVPGLRCGGSGVLCRFLC